MKKIFTLTAVAIFSTLLVEAQSVSINTDGSMPDNSALLDVKSTNKGLLLPRMTSVERAAIASPATGLMVYQTNGTAGFYYNAGTPATPNWQLVGSGSLTGWSTTGNSGTNPSTNFIGTTDNNNLVFKINNSPAGLLSTNGNSFWGKNSGFNNTSAYSNVAIGNSALFSNTGRSNLVAIGDSALYMNGTGASIPIHSSGNTAIGSKSLFSNTIGLGNTTIGASSLYSNANGSFNTATGVSSLYSNISGLENTAMGYQSLYSNSSGSYNTATGRSALYNNNVGANNSAFGHLALFKNTSGASNVAIGNKALFNNTDRSNLVAIGDSALYNNGIGVTNTGHAKGNTAIGSKALYANTTGSGNTATGVSALESNTTGLANIATGQYALNSNIGGSNNTAIGSQALYSNTSGNGNTAGGYNSLIENITGGNNTANGSLSLNFSTTGSNNAAYGTAALYFNTSGSDNSGFGIGADVGFNNLNNATAIGAYSLSGCSNCMVLGSINGVHTATSDTKVGIGTTLPAARLHIKANSSSTLAQLLLEEDENDFVRMRFSNSTANKYWEIASLTNTIDYNAALNFNYYGVGYILRLIGDGSALLRGTLTQSSDARLKTNIIPLANLSGGLAHLNGYTYQWKNKSMDQSVQIGLLAQEVEKYFPQLVKADEKGYKSVNYIGFIPLLIEGMKEQSQKIESLGNEVKLMKEEIRQIKANTKRNNK